MRKDHGMRQLLLLLLVGGLSGCGSNVSPTGQLSGSIQVKGKPVVATIMLLGEDPRHQFMATSDTEGNYAVATPMPVGLYKAAVLPPVGPPPEETTDPAGTSTTLPKIWTDGTIDPKVQSPETSGIEVKLSVGDNRLDVTL